MCLPVLNKPFIKLCVSWDPNVNIWGWIGSILLFLLCVVRLLTVHRLLTDCNQYCMLLPGRVKANGGALEGPRIFEN